MLILSVFQNIANMNITFLFSNCNAKTQKAAAIFPYAAAAGQGRRSSPAAPHIPLHFWGSAGSVHQPVHEPCLFLFGVLIDLEHLGLRRRLHWPRCGV